MTEMDLPTVSTLRAKVAKRTVQAQVELSCAKLRDIYFGSPRVADPAFFGIPINVPDDVDPRKGAAPGFRDVDFGELDKLDPTVPDRPVHLKIGVIGGGMGGLYASLILQDLGIEHEVVEATGRPGGRVWSYHFSKKPGDYYEVGAMLFPDIPIMTRTFKLLQLLGITRDTNPHPGQGHLIHFRHSGPNNPWLFNNILKTGGPAPSESDPFRVSVENGGTVDGRFVSMGCREILRKVFEEWRNRLVSDFEPTWAALMALDQRVVSLRSYLIEKFRSEAAGSDRNQVISNLYYMTNWCETMDAGSRHYDAAFISWVLLSLEFEYPAPTPPTYDTVPIVDHHPSSPSHDYSWWCLNGGTDIVAKRTVARLTKNPLYNLGQPGSRMRRSRTRGEKSLR